MEPKTTRIFVGNLPLDVEDDDVKNIMKKYVSVNSVEIKRRDNGLFAYVDVLSSKSDLDHCLKNLSLKKWKGHQLQVELAKESFLQRLARERLENQKKCTRSTDIPIEHSSKVDLNDQEIKCVGSEDSEDSSDSEICMRGNLPMFNGTKALKRGKPRKENSDYDLQEANCVRICDEEKVLQKLERFNNVWKDENVSDSKISSLGGMKESNSFNSRQESVVNAKLSSKIDKVLTEPISADMHIHSGKTKHEEAEKRRRKAMEDKNKEIVKRKCAVKFALASVDSVNNNIRPNKRIIFSEHDDDFLNNGSEDNLKEKKITKLMLFHDNMECETSNENDFRIRKHYEGVNGQSLLALQAQYGNDKRFILDERFVENENGKQEEHNAEADNLEAEKKQILNILGNVLGKQMSNPENAKQRHSTKLMVRYDPSLPGHEKFEIKQDSDLPKIKYNKKTNKIQETHSQESTADTLPTISKEKYYHVSDLLMESLKEENKKFSLLEMFGDENERDEDLNAPPPPPLPISKKKWTLNPCEEDSSISEDEKIEQNNIIDDYSNNVGVEQESLFFAENDARFIEGLEFINDLHIKHRENFDEIRQEMKQVIKRKVLKHRGKSERWKSFGERRKLFSTRK